MRTSVNESVNKWVKRLDTSVNDPLKAWLRQRGNRRRLAVTMAAIAIPALLLFFFLKTQDFDARREADVLTQLLAAKAIDVRWDMAIADARADGRTRALTQPDDVERMHAALDAAALEIPTRVMQETAAELKKIYAQKGDLVARFIQASSDARVALTAAMRADAAIGNQVRAVWRDFPQRDRLVAAENLVARTLAEAQAYHRAPSAERRAALQAFATDLARAHALPAPVEGTLKRLETDIDQLLLLKPLEEATDARLGAITTAGYLDEIIALVQRRQADGVASRARYRGYLVMFLSLLVVAGAFFAFRAADRYRTLRARLARAESALAALQDPDEAVNYVSETPAATAEVIDIAAKPHRAG